jgi:peptidoglycan LD-endopeptidase LytH
MDPSIRWPLASNVIRRNSESNTFGMVRHNSDGSKRAHQGWDFYAPGGTNCHAIASGTVAFSAKSGAYGNLLIHSFVLEGQSYFAAYAHLQDIAKSVGDHVNRGDLIGHTGTTGNAAGMTGLDQHLHFEIRTILMPGLGLAGRVTPLRIFRAIPLDDAVAA